MPNRVRRLHAEPRASHRFDRRGRPVDLDLHHSLPAEEVEQQLPWEPGDMGRGVPAACSDGLRGPRPPELESRPAQSPCQEPGRTPDVAPKGLIHRMIVRSRTTTVGSANVLVMDEELVEVSEPAHPPDPEDAWRRSRSDRRDEPGEVLHCERPSSPFSKAAPRTGQDQPGSSERVVLAKDEVRGQIARRPRLKQSGCFGTQLLEQVAQLCSLDGVEEHTGHTDGV